MIAYEITATVAAELAPRYEAYMREEHIPALLGTGCFEAARFSRAAPGQYRMRYEAPDRESLERYLALHAPGLRAEFEAQFPAGVTLTRATWELIQAWP
jgi:hypothetical protein